MNYTGLNFGPDFEDRTGHVYEYDNPDGTKGKIGITHGTSVRTGPICFNDTGSISMGAIPRKDDILGPWEVVSNYCKEWFISGVDENNNVKPWGPLPEGVQAVQGWVNEYRIQMLLQSGDYKRIK